MALPTITLEAVTAALPAKLQPWAQEYGPAFLKMTVAEFQAWVNLLVGGDVYTAYTQLLAKMPEKADYLKALQDNATAWSAANTANNASIALQKQALTALAGIALTIGLAVFGF